MALCCVCQGLLSILFFMVDGSMLCVSGSLVYIVLHGGWLYVVYVRASCLYCSSWWMALCCVCQGLLSTLFFMVDGSMLCMSGPLVYIVLHGRWLYVVYVRASCLCCSSW